MTEVAADELQDLAQRDDFDDVLQSFLQVTTFANPLSAERFVDFDMEEATEDPAVPDVVEILATKINPPATCDDDSVERPIIGIAEAKKALDTLRAFFEQQPETCTTRMRALGEMQNSLERARSKTMTQQQLTKYFVRK